MICFYHKADLDGLCSAAIVKVWDREAGLFPMDYGDPVPWDAVPSGSSVMVVDFSFPMGDMERLDGERSLVWIDHHKTAIAEAEERGFNPAGKREVGMAACELTWEYLFAPKPRPHAVTLLGRYDVWDFDPADDVLPFQYGVRRLRPQPGDEVWEFLMLGASRESYVQDLVRDGRVILDYEAQESARLVRECGFAARVWGLRLICLNRLRANSRAFESVWDPKKFDAMLAFGWSGTKWMFSLYTEKPGVDVSEVAKANGGGGHTGAAGFQTPDLPNELWKAMRG